MNPDLALEVGHANYCYLQSKAIQPRSLLFMRIDIYFVKKYPMCRILCIGSWGKTFILSKAISSYSSQLYDTIRLYVLANIMCAVIFYCHQFKLSSWHIYAWKGKLRQYFIRTHGLSTWLIWRSYNRTTKPGHIFQDKCLPLPCCYDIKFLIGIFGNCLQLDVVWKSSLKSSEASCGLKKTFWNGRVQFFIVIVLLWAIHMQLDFQCLQSFLNYF